MRDPENEEIEEGEADPENEEIEEGETDPENEEIEEGEADPERERSRERKMSKIIQVRGTDFIDAQGNVFIPHGINMVCKDRERGYLGDYRQEDFAFLKQKGFNLIRLGLQWAAAEPQPGVFDEAYFQGIDALIERAAAADIPVFLDMHQDLYGVKFEDGAPEWATLDEGAEHVRTQLWSESYLMSPAIWNCFDNFWKNAPAEDGLGVRDHFRKCWEYIARRYADHPYVIGYDLLNEPFPGTPGAQVGQILGEMMADPAALADPEAIMAIVERILPITAAFEEEILNPFYNEMFAAIRAVDPETILMLESNYFANAGIPSRVRPAVFPSGEQIPGQAYAPHGYDILVDTEAYQQGGNERVDFIFGSILNHAREIGIPAFIGEWGCYPNASKAQKDQARHLLALFSAAGVGQTYFDFSHIRDGGILEVLEN